MGPVLVNEVFELNDKITFEIHDEYIVSDNLFKDWFRIRNAFIDAPAFNWKMPYGSRNFTDYYDCRHFFLCYHDIPFEKVISETIERCYKVKTKLQYRRIETNWFKQITPKTSDWASIHVDSHSMNNFTVITYLNTQEECVGGTTLFKDLDFVEGQDGANYWSETKQYGNTLNIEMKPGRTIIFRSMTPHAAWHPVDSFYEFPRLTMAYWFS
jgi:hypothetical protein